MVNSSSIRDKRKIRALKARIFKLEHPSTVPDWSTDNNDEVERIIELLQNTNIDDFKQWIVCLFMTGHDKSRLEHCTIENWKSDKKFMTKMMKLKMMTVE